ncbi:hypothetical protein IV203_008235 [Nitzschia inconspicua]|uniref:PiggyBac transposable element-derived protein domain-containing protein n=1 Tax=Nitzschia inconspicua TaxID=303405 RepID=A0A9K3KYG9_9STRA|nr:hypothetical protein IV203_008235 [Nitzschia inconspicua]
MSQTTTGSCPAAPKASGKVSSLVVGAKCQAKACMVTDLSECSGRYGSFAKTKILEGVVLESISMKNPTTNRTANHVRARYDLGGGHLKDVTLHIRSVEVVSESVRASPSPAAGLLHLPSPVTAPAMDPALSPPTEVGAATLPPTPAPAVAPAVAPSPAVPVVTTHEVDWFIDDEAVLHPIGQPTPRRNWSIKTPIGDVLQAGSNADKRLTKMDVFLLAFPPESLVSICRNTNVVLEATGIPTTTVGELLKFFVYFRKLWLHTLGVERKLVTKSWDKRVGLSIFSMIVVNAYRMYMGLTYPRGGARDESQKLFYERLAEELILNQYDLARRVARSSNELADGLGHCPPVINKLDGTPRMGTHAHLTPTKRKRKGTNFALQGNCRVCRKKTKYLCSCCKDEAVATQKEPLICSTEKWKLCFSRHLQDVHRS